MCPSIVPKINDGKSSSLPLEDSLFVVQSGSLGIKIAAIK